MNYLLIYLIVVIITNILFYLSFYKQGMLKHLIRGITGSYQTKIGMFIGMTIWTLMLPIVEIIVFCQTIYYTSPFVSKKDEEVLAELVRRAEAYRDKNDTSSIPEESSRSLPISNERGSEDRTS